MVWREVFVFRYVLLAESRVQRAPGSSLQENQELNPPVSPCPGLQTRQTAVVLFNHIAASCEVL